MKRKNNFLTTIRNQIEKKGEISPFLCLGKPLSEVHCYLREQIEVLCLEYGVDKNYIFTLSDTGESLKIQEMKQFMERANQKSSFLFQVFIIENYARATVEASNAALKFFEEPGVGNIIFLTSESEAGILDTILSRVKIERIGNSTVQKEDETWRERILRYVEENDTELVSYIYQEKIGKDDALAFLFALLSLHKTGQIVIPDIDELERDMQGLEKNNLLPRYIVDKHFLFLG